MKRATGVCVLLGCLTAVSVFADPVDITYSIDQIDPDSWQYTYTVQNNAITDGIEAFTIWYDDTLYETLAVASSSPITTTWDEVIVQPEPVLGDDGYYDALEITGGSILLGQAVSGFSVTFDWLGQDTPASQYFEIFDPADYSQPIATGDTIPVPEPATLSLLALGGLVLIRKRKKLSPC